MLLNNVKEIEIPEGKVKQISRGSEILWKKNGLTLINAIIGTGTQYIKLGKKIRQNYTFEMMIECTSKTNTASNEIFGADLESGSWPNGMSILIYQGGSVYFYKNYYNYAQASQGFWTAGRTMKISNTDTSLTVQRIENGSVVETLNINVSGNLSGLTREAYLMRFNTDQNFGYNAGMFKFKSLKVWDENKSLMMNIVPALDSSGIPCVVDLVDNRILYNAGTGEFGYE